MNNVKKKQAYGGIINCSLYLTDRYGEKPVFVKRGRSLNVNQMSMEQISGRKTRNCSVVAVTRVVDYYRQVNKIESIPGDIHDIYKVVEEIATAYGYSDKRGLSAFYFRYHQRSV